jgi:hypothetical protein
MQMKRGSIALVLIQLFVFSAIVRGLSPTVSAAHTDTKTTLRPDLSKLPAREEVGLDWFNHTDDLELEFVLGEVLVKFRTGISVGSKNGIVTTGIASVDKLNRRFEAKAVEKVFSNVYKLTLPKDSDVLFVAREYEADPNVEYAEPNGTK